MTFSNRLLCKSHQIAAMRQTPLKTTILTTLLAQEDLVPALWSRAGEAMGKEIPLRTFYEAIYRLRDDGLVQYQSRQMSDAQVSDLLTELAGGEPAADDAGDDVGQVRLTTRGRAHAELLSLQELIPAPRQREAARRIQHLQEILSTVSSGAGP
jgi:hypothetical protein